MKKELCTSELENISGGMRPMLHPRPRTESLYDRVRSPSRKKRNKSRGQYRRSNRK